MSFLTILTWCFMDISGSVFGWYGRNCSFLHYMFFLFFQNSLLLARQMLMQSKYISQHSLWPWDQVPAHGKRVAFSWNFPWKIADVLLPLLHPFKHPASSIAEMMASHNSGPWDQGPYSKAASSEQERAQVFSPWGLHGAELPFHPDATFKRLSLKLVLFYL